MTGMISNIWKKIIILMDNSVFFCCINAVLNFFKDVFSQSLLIKFISMEADGQSYKKSFVSKLTDSILKFFNDHAVLFFKDSVIIRFVMRFPLIRYPEWGIFAVAALAPFIPTMALAGLIGVTAVCFAVRLIGGGKYAISFDITGIALLIYVFVTLFTGVTSFTPRSSINIALLTSFFMAAYFFVLILINTKQKLSFFVFTLSASAALTGLYGLYQKFSGRVDMTWVDKELFEGLSLRVFSTFGNPNVYAEYLLLIIPVCAVMVYVSKNLLLRLYYVCVTVLLTVNLGLAYSRGCYLALAFSVLVFMLLMEKRLVALFTAGLVALPFVLPTSIINRVLSITNFEDSSTSYRISIWKATIRILRDFWYSGLGQGIDAYNTVYPLYGFSAVTAPHSHNLYMQVFVETGIVGLIVFLALIACFFKTQIPFFYKTKVLEHKVFSGAMMAGMIGFLFSGLFDYVFYNYRVFLVFFIMLAAGNAYVHVNRERVPRR